MSDTQNGNGRPWTYYWAGREVRTPSHRHLSVPYELLYNAAALGITAEELQVVMTYKALVYIGQDKAPTAKQLAAKVGLAQQTVRTIIHSLKVKGYCRTDPEHGPRALCFDPLDDCLMELLEGTRQPLQDKPRIIDWRQKVLENEHKKCSKTSSFDNGTCSKTSTLVLENEHISDPKVLENEQQSARKRAHSNAGSLVPQRFQAPLDQSTERDISTLLPPNGGRRGTATPSVSDTDKDLLEVLRSIPGWQPDDRLDRTAIDLARRTYPGADLMRAAQALLLQGGVDKQRKPYRNLRKAWVNWVGVSTRERGTNHGRADAHRRAGAGAPAAPGAPGADGGDAEEGHFERLLRLRAERDRAAAEAEAAAGVGAVRPGAGGAPDLDGQPDAPPASGAGA